MAIDITSGNAFLTKGAAATLATTGSGVALLHDIGKPPPPAATNPTVRAYHHHGCRRQWRAMRAEGSRRRHQLVIHLHLRFHVTALEMGSIMLTMTWPYHG